MHRIALFLLPALALAWPLALPVPARAQADAGADSSLVRAPDASGGARRHSPRGALLRALIVPGWGQVYNRQFVKVPFVYAALGGVTALAVTNYTRHRDARRAFLYAAGLDDDPNPYAAYAAYYVGTRYESLSARQLFEFKNGLRRDRDLSFLAVLVVHGLAVLDAYVAAHLYDFDVSEDLSVGPWEEEGRWGVSVRLRW